MAKRVVYGDRNGSPTKGTINEFVRERREEWCIARQA